ncbi:MAG: nitrous oxide reductase accessory protein NosL [Flavobacteriaceae bacterium]|nr:nitrous oxide reductase accessory protein NosL [Flavobacteriaceae bacterium]
MKLITTLSLISLFFIFTACEVQPQKIEYGKDACHFCRMNIVDQQHAAQLVTKKGKAFKFDATECLIDHLSEIDITQIELFLVTDYNNPGNLIDAKTSSYIISENIPSPMGAFLSAVLTKAEAETLQKSKTGTVYNWEELLLHLNKK